tara:strand:+ start:338 stop:652 length:315 start_codon:yes stop_codon:yes gene_type:complete
MNIKNNIKYLLIFFFVNTLISGQYFSFSNYSNKKELILLCNDNIYYPVVLTHHNLDSHNMVDINIPKNRVPKITTSYNNKYSVYLELTNTTINYNQGSTYYLKN